MSATMNTTTATSSTGGVTVNFTTSPPTFTFATRAASACPDCGHAVPMGVTDCPECGMSIMAADMLEPFLAADDLPGWEATLAFEGLATSDGRYLMPGKIDQRDLPMTLMAQTTTADGHDGAEVAGRIDAIRREPQPDKGENVTAIIAEGQFADTEFGREMAKLVEDEILRGVSVDLSAKSRKLLDSKTYAEVPEEEIDLASLMEGKYVTGIEGTIMGATLVPFPAFGDAQMRVVTPEAALAASAFWLAEGPQLRLVAPALTASAAGAAPLAPPKAWFETPEANEPTPLTVTPEGQVYGHLALWNQCHSAFPSCELAPRSKTEYAYFHTGQMVTAEDEVVNVGRITVGEKGNARGGHASIVLGIKGAMEHYDNTATVGAYVRAKDGVHGIWLSGAVRPDCPAAKIVEMRANQASGDWRLEPKVRNRELVAALCVPVGGLSIPRYEARVASAGVEGDEEVLTLIATGYVPKEVAGMDRAEQRRKTMLLASVREALSSGYRTNPETIHLTADEMQVLSADLALEGAELYKDYPAAQRRRMAQSGQALPDGSFPIANCSDASDAIHRVGSTNNRGRAEAHIRKRVRALGCSGSMFDNWK